ncbi:MAG TPA: hypothetical protein VHM31_15065 [Polyangia bacterium]|nr:hypothetical protein [Polyangia bacterium]
MRWVLVVVWLVGSAGDARAGDTCASSAETVIGYSAQRDQYLTEERSVDGAEPPRYVIRRLSTDEVVDYVTCADGGPCTKGDALGLKACSFRPVPRNIPDDLSLGLAGSDESIAEVLGAGKTGPVALLRVRRAGQLVLRSGARSGSSVVVFLTDTVEDDTCGETTHERAIMVSEPAGPSTPPEVDLTVAPAVGIDVREAQPPSPAALQTLTTAARTAAAAHLDGLAGCWAQQALAMISAAQQRRVPKKPIDPSVELESVRVVVVAPHVPARRRARAGQGPIRP